MNTIKINNHLIGRGHAVYIIAEAGVNHNGSLELALELVRKAKETGADCVKFQTFKASNIVTANAPKAEYQLHVTDPKESQLEMLKKLEMPDEHYPPLIALCKELDIDFMSTPYSRDAADRLEKMGVGVYKIASSQLPDTPLLQHVARKGKPVILSTGMANLAEVYNAVKVLRDTGNEQIILLQCTTNYPSRIEDANVLAMNTMRDSININTGYSDHVANNYACYSAVALGACVIEKHFTLDVNMEGPDHSSSLDPAGFKELVNGIRNIEASLGSSVKEPCETEKQNTEGMRRSIVSRRDIKAGAIILDEDLILKRPAIGISPTRWYEVVGRKAAQDIPADNTLQNFMINWSED